MAVIGITGPIGAGKSLAAEQLRALGADVLDVDRLAHEFLEPDRPTFRRLVEAFGPEILDESGRIDRGRLGALVFKDRGQLERLNRLIHPLLLQSLRERMDRFRSQRPGEVLGLDAALLFQWGLERECDVVLWIDAPVEIRRRRFVGTGRLNAEEFERRDALQQKYFDGVSPGRNVVRIVNGGTQSELAEQINRFWKKVKDHES